MVQIGDTEQAAERMLRYERNVPQSFEVQFRAQSDWRFWETAAFYFGGVGGGLYVVSQILQLQIGLIVGYVLVVVLKNGAHLLSASKPSRALRAFANPKSSWVSRGSYFLFLFTVFAALNIACQFELIEVGDVIENSASILAFLSACLIMIYIGFVMGQSRAIPLWYTPTLPVMLLTYSLAMGGGAGFLHQLVIGIEQRFIFLGWWLLITDGLTLLLAVISVCMVSISSPAARISVQQLTKGKLGVLFVGGALIAGLLIPMILNGYGLIEKDFSSSLCFLVGILTLLGGFMFEFALLRAGVHNTAVNVDCGTVVRF